MIESLDPATHKWEGTYLVKSFGDFADLRAYYDNAFEVYIRTGKDAATSDWVVFAQANDENEAQRVAETALVMGLDTGSKDKYYGQDTVRSLFGACDEPQARQTLRERNANNT